MMSELHDALIEFTIEEQVLYAAACVRLYCAAKHIEHVAFAQWLDHLEHIMTTDSLPDWEAKVRQLAFPCLLGDPWPPDITEAVPSGLREEFATLADAATEIGYGAMWGGWVPYPFQDLMHVVTILNDNGIHPPDPRPFATGLPTSFPWKHTDGA